MRRPSARGLVPLGSALALAVSGTATALLVAGSASAAAPKLMPSDLCKTLTANAASGTTATLSNCRSDRKDAGSKHETKGVGTFPLSAITTGSGTITWMAPYEGGTKAKPAHTDIMKIVATPVGGTGQPGDEKETMPCPTGQQEIKITGIVGPTDTTDPPGENDVGGKVKAEACVDATTGAVTLEPGTAFKISGPAPG